MRRIGSLVAVLFLISVFGTSVAHAQGELVLDTQTTSKAQVVSVLGQEERLVPGTDTKTIYQKLQVKILDGAEAGKEVSVDNDYLQLSPGEVFYLVHTTNSLDGRDYYAVGEPYRLPALFFFVGLFVLCVMVFGGWQGMRGLLSLVGSFLFIGFLLLPGILHGYPPLLLAMGVSSLIIILGSYVTHGFNKTTTTAVGGMILTIIVTGLIAYAAVYYTKLSGFESEEATFLNLGTRGTIDFVGLLLGGIMIGLLGVMYDAAIGQAVAVEELYRAGPELSRKTIFTRALRIGREHIGALVNTLAIAYVGASLPLLLLFYSSGANFWVTLNREIFSAEIIRTMVGSIGLVLAVPITTLIATLFLAHMRNKPHQR